MADCEHSWMVKGYEMITTCIYCGMPWDDWNAVYVAKLEKDKNRLDWLLGEPERVAWLHSLWFIEDDRPKSPREAIDKQMGEEKVIVKKEE